MKYLNVDKHEQLCVDLDLIRTKFLGLLIKKGKIFESQRSNVYV